MFLDFSAPTLCSLRLCGYLSTKATDRRDAKYAETTQRVHYLSLT